jgi:hypothetical protein
VNRQKNIIAFSIFGLIVSLASWSGTEALETTIVDVDQRNEEVEKKQEKDDEELGILSDLSKYVSLGGVLSGAYQYELVNAPPTSRTRGEGPFLLNQR